MIEGAGVFLLFAAIVVGVLLILVVAFFALSRLFARGSGWSELANVYPASRQPEGLTYTHQHSRVGSVRYRNCSTIGISAAGLYLAVTAPFLSNHPPLLVPWSAITGIQQTRLYWLSAVQLSIGEPQIATLTVLKHIFEPMRPYLSRR
jgi:hypothetical protein